MTSATDLIVNVGGRLSHRDRAMISPFDSVVQGGDAVWEGLRLYAGRVFRLDEHLARLRDSARALAFAVIPSAGEITEQLRRTLAANGMHDGVHIRLTLTRGIKVTSGMDPRLNASGPTLIVLAEFKDPVYDASGIRLITASVRRPAPDCLDPKIHHNNLLPSILAKIEANVAGADDAVMLDHRDEHLPGRRGPAWHAVHRRLPGGDHPADGARPRRAGGHRDRCRRLQPD